MKLNLSRRAEWKQRVLSTIDFAIVLRMNLWKHFEENMEEF